MMLQRISIFDLATLEVMNKEKAIVLSAVGGNIEFNKENNIILFNNDYELTAKQILEAAKKVMEHQPDLVEWRGDFLKTLLDTDAVKRHYDEGGKNCPKYYVEHEDAWERLVLDIGQYIEDNGTYEKPEEESGAEEVE